MDNNSEILVVGGGLAGLVSAYLLAKQNRSVILVEKKYYPFHRVCGEYLSNEVFDFLKREQLLPENLDLPQIKKFQFSDTRGQEALIDLDMGGFGISRYRLDEHIYQRALAAGVDFRLGLQVEELSFDPGQDGFRLTLSDHQELTARYVIGAFGKRSKLDKSMDRDFIKNRSPFLGVKYHIQGDLPSEVVALHNFSGGYCGVNAVEDGRFNLCYLGSRDQLRDTGSIPEMEEKYLWTNPRLREIFTESRFLFERPEVINEINFEPKSPVEHHVLMAGDAAGLITPLCGNGMAIAIRSGKLAAEAILEEGSRSAIERRYDKEWRHLFQRRLWIGRKVQWLFGSPKVSGFTRGLIGQVPFLANQIIRNTHGEEF